jgi:hypothetical protein
MPKNKVLKDFEVAALVALAAVVIGCVTYLAANHIVPADVSNIADSGLLVTVIGAIFHSLGLKSLPIASVENLLNQFGALVQQAQQPTPAAPPVTSVTVGAPVNLATPSNVTSISSAPSAKVEAAG